MSGVGKGGGEREGGGGGLVGQRSAPQEQEQVHTHSQSPYVTHARSHNPPPHRARELSLSLSLSFSLSLSLSLFCLSTACLSPSLSLSAPPPLYFPASHYRSLSVSSPSLFVTAPEDGGLYEEHLTASQLWSKAARTLHASRAMEEEEEEEEVRGKEGIRTCSAKRGIDNALINDCHVFNDFDVFLSSSCRLSTASAGAPGEPHSSGLRGWVRGAGHQIGEDEGGRGGGDSRDGSGGGGGSQSINNDFDMHLVRTDMERATDSVDVCTTFAPHIPQSLGIPDRQDKWTEGMCGRGGSTDPLPGRSHAMSPLSCGHAFSSSTSVAHLLSPVRAILAAETQPAPSQPATLQGRVHIREGLEGYDDPDFVPFQGTLC